MWKEYKKHSATDNRCSASVILLFREWEFLVEVMNQAIIEEVVFHVGTAE